MQFPEVTGLSFNLDAQGQQDLVLDDFVDLDHIFDDYLARNFADERAAAPVAQPQNVPMSTAPSPAQPNNLLQQNQQNQLVGNVQQQQRTPFFAYPTDLANLHYSFNALPSMPITSGTPQQTAAAPTGPPVMPAITTTGAPAVPAASEANSIPAKAPKARGASARRAAAVVAKINDDDSDSGSGVDSASSDEPRSKKKSHGSLADGDKTLAERRHQALQEKNRRAQRRFRERQKAKIQDLHKQIEELTSRVGNLQSENTALQSRTSILEKVLEMRNEQIQVMQETKEDASEAGEQEAAQGQALAVQGQGSGALEALNPELLRRLTPEEMTAIYQKYVGELGHRLMELNQNRTPQQQHSVELLVKDVLLLLMRFSIVKPLETRKFVAGSRLSIPSEADALVLWKGAMNKLELSDEQKREMVALKREFLSSMEGVMEQRRQLNVQIQAHFPHASFHTKIALAYIKAHEAVAKLKENLRNEHRLVLEFSAALFKKILAPIQMATLLVHAFPAVPDSLAISSAVAAELGEEPLPLPAFANDSATLSNTALLLQALAPGSGSDTSPAQMTQALSAPVTQALLTGGPQVQATQQQQQQQQQQQMAQQQLLQQVAAGEVKLTPQMLQMMQMGGMGMLNPLQQQFLAFQQQQQQQQQQQRPASMQQQAVQALQQQQQQAGGAGQQGLSLAALVSGAVNARAAGLAADESSSGSSSRGASSLRI